MRLKDTIRFIIDSTKGIYDPREAEGIAFILLEFIGIPRKQAVLQPDIEIDGKQMDFLVESIRELKTSRPIQYILGETEFFGLKFRVNENVLIPRQETEELVQRIISENRRDVPEILDLGTGSGCISISLAKNISSANVTATDISAEALKIADKNAEMNLVSINTIRDDMLNPRLDKTKNFDIIVSNPPYVRDTERQFMHPNVLNYEPEIALFVRNNDPLEFYKAISGIAIEMLKAGGSLYVEINEAYGNEVVALFSESGFSNPTKISDINDKDRFVKAIKPE